MDDATHQQPLFQNMDEQERIYSPETVPGTGDMPAQEVDADSAAHQGNSGPGLFVLPSPSSDVSGANAGIGTNGPLIAPVVNADNDRLDEDHEHTR